jgi:hypothetical protein
VVEEKSRQFSVVPTTFSITHTTSPVELGSYLVKPTFQPSGEMPLGGNRAGKDLVIAVYDRRKNDAGFVE